MPDQQPRRNVTIKSASFKKGIFLKGEYTEVMGKAGEQVHKFDCTVPVHDDLRIAFRALRPHCVNLAEVFDSSGLAALDTISVLGFSIGGDAEKEGISLSFTHDLKSGKEVSINTPFTRWDDQNSPYELAGDLSLAIEDCKAEVYAYLFEDKHQPDNQGELFPEGEEGI